ncbi:MAG: phage/plasmid primase-like uncharacterized protein [Alteromonadaceae bacterium]
MASLPERFFDILVHHSRLISPLRLLFDLYDDYKATSKTPKAVTAKPPADKQQRELRDHKRRLQLEQTSQKGRVAEAKIFKTMRSLSDQKAYSPYLNTKRVTDVAKAFDIRIGRDEHGYFTCFSLYDINGQFGGLQRIYHQKPAHWQDNKSTSKGFNPIGHFAVFGGDLNTVDMVYICEGLATGLAIYKATGRPVVVCLMAENIAPVSGLIAQYYPDVKRVHVADNDQGKPDFGNTGVYQCAVAVQKYGGWVFVPQPSRGNDANDVLVYDGLKALKQQIHHMPINYFNEHYSQYVSGIFNYRFG